jgi:uncharacterized membrane protein YczE
LDQKKVKYQTETIITMLIVALFIGLVGWYTDNSGFIFAGVIFLVVGLAMGINHSKQKGT